MPRLLILTRHPPLPDYDGAGAYLWDMLSYFSAHGFKVEVASIWKPGDWDRARLMRVPAALHRTANLQFPHVLAIGRWRWFSWGAFKARASHVLRTLFFNVGRSSGIAAHTAPPPVSAARLVSAHDAWSAGPSAAELVFFQQRIRRFRPDAVIANFCWLAPALPRIGGIRTAILAHDVMSIKLPLQATAPVSATGPLDPATPQGEAALLGHADAVLAISGSDAGAFRAMLSGSARVIVTPKAARLAALAPGMRPESGRVLFVGSRNPPNREALAWLVDDIWPRVKAKVPHACLHVCGDVASDLVATDPTILGRGRVADLTPEYRAAEVVVVPLLRGSGVKIKLVEAAAHGCAIVTTSVGLQGLDALRPATREADDAAIFADHVSALLVSAATRAALEEAVRLAARAHLSPDAAYGPVLEWLRSA